MRVTNLIFRVTKTELQVRGRVYRNVCDFDEHSARFDIITGKPAERTDFALAVLKCREARDMWTFANRKRLAADRIPA